MRWCDGWLRPMAGMGVYSISKAAVLMMTRVLALELAPANIQVNAIAPGFVKTKFSQAIWSNPKLNKLILGKTPQRRIADPEELTGIALYLAADASSFTTGATFTIDGGLLAGNPAKRARNAERGIRNSSCGLSSPCADNAE